MNIKVIPSSGFFHSKENQSLITAAAMQGPGGKGSIPLPDFALTYIKSTLKHTRALSRNCDFPLDFTPSYDSVSDVMMRRCMHYKEVIDNCSSRKLYVTIKDFIYVSFSNHSFIVSAFISVASQNSSL